jgi:hypothetical protein
MKSYNLHHHSWREQQQVMENECCQSESSLGSDGLLLSSPFLCITSSSPNSSDFYPENGGSIFLWNIAIYSSLITPHDVTTQKTTICILHERHMSLFDTSRENINVTSCKVIWYRSYICVQYFIGEYHWNRNKEFIEQFEWSSNASGFYLRFS